jgi:hypothetical protein
MEMHPSPNGDGSPRDAQAAKLSYKFQRLREKLRHAIASGELSGKLPGERQLAKRFRVNAKTLSKALTDLAAEGLLDRSIGRGTFVNSDGSDRAASPIRTSDRWLIICAPDQVNLTLIKLICDANPNSHVITDTSNLRPSLLNQFKAAIDFEAAQTPETVLRDLLVRGINVVLVDRESSTYLMNAVEVDRTLGTACLARDLMLAGHTQFFAIERRGHTAVVDAIRRAAQRYAPRAAVDHGFAADVPAALQRGCTAFLCETRQTAVQVREVLESRGAAIPGAVSLAAVGAGIGHYPCSGYFVTAEQKAEAIISLLRDGNNKRPTTLWLTGAYVDLGTTAPPPSAIHTRTATQADAVQGGQWKSITA